jgi:hypothetical protein
MFIIIIIINFSVCLHAYSPFCPHNGVTTEMYLFYFSHLLIITLIFMELLLIYCSYIDCRIFCLFVICVLLCTRANYVIGLGMLSLHVFK